MQGGLVWPDVDGKQAVDSSLSSADKSGRHLHFLSPVALHHLHIHDREYENQFDFSLSKNQNEFCTAHFSRCSPALTTNPFYSGSQYSGESCKGKSESTAWHGANISGGELAAVISHDLFFFVSFSLNSFDHNKCLSALVTKSLFCQLQQEVVK